MRHPIYGMWNAAALHAARIAATPPRGIKHSICILLFNISLCYPQPSARGRHVTHCCHGSWCTRAAAMCLLSVGADLSPFTNDRIWNYNFGKSKRIVMRWWREERDSSSLSEDSEVRWNIQFLLCWWIVLSKQEANATFTYFKCKIFFGNIFAIIIITKLLLKLLLNLKHYLSFVKIYEVENKQPIDLTKIYKKYIYL